MHAVAEEYVIVVVADRLVHACCRGAGFGGGLWNQQRRRRDCRNRQSNDRHCRNAALKS